jgi:hypothetical protein
LVIRSSSKVIIVFSWLVELESSLSSNSSLSYLRCPILIQDVVKEYVFESFSSQDSLIFVNQLPSVSITYIICKYSWYNVKMQLYHKDLKDCSCIFVSIHVFHVQNFFKKRSISNEKELWKGEDYGCVKDCSNITWARHYSMHFYSFQIEVLCKLNCFSIGRNRRGTWWLRNGRDFFFILSRDTWDSYPKWYEVWVSSINIG